MPVIHQGQKIPTYPFEPDGMVGNPNFRLYNYEGNFPNPSELLVPHRKDYYLIVFIKRGGSRQWIDMTPYTLRDNAVYFTGPHEVIVKEEIKQLWSTGIAFTNEFLSLHEIASLRKLPILQNPHGCHELLLAEQDVTFIEDTLTRITDEYKSTGAWQQRMLSAHLNVLLTYLSRLYTEQAKNGDASTDNLLLKNFQAQINECFRERHEVSDYASLLNISAGHLSEVVKTKSGKPAIKHIHDRLVLEARRLLLHTESSLKEIAFHLGFSDASYFNRFFKRETGSTPAEYRANIREMYH